MKNLLTFIVLHLVQHPDDVEVMEEHDQGYDIYFLKVHPEDMGRIIGKKGSIIQAIRQIAKVRAMKEDRKIVIKMFEPETEASTTE